MKRSGKIPILLVEDDNDAIDLTLRAFARYKPARHIFVARTGEEALAWIPRWAAGEARPGLILLDLKLPGLSGLDVLSHLKAHPASQPIPVVVLTSSAEGSTIATAYRLGASSYIVKPVDFGEFMDIATRIEHYWLDLNQPPYAATLGGSTDSEPHAVENNETGLRPAAPGEK
jgi:CheY-like chemotaxis protein